MTARLATVRVLVAGYSAVWLAVRAPYLLGLADLPERRWRPVGVLAPLAVPPPAAVVATAVAAAVAAGAVVVAGRAVRVAAPVWALALLAVTTYASSWGQLFHTENLLVLHAVVLAAAAVLPTHRRPDPELVLRALAVVAVATYVAAGIAKLRGSGWGWFDGDVLRDKVGFDNLRKELFASSSSPLGAALVGQAWPWPALATLTMAVELGAPVALLGRRWAAGWAVAAWAFHAGVLALMAIAFPYPLLGIAFAPLLPVERVLPNLRGRWIASSSPSPSVAPP